MIRLTRTQLQIRAKDRPPGYLEDILAAASRIEGNEIFLTPEAHQALVDKYRGAVPREPRGFELAQNFTGAMARFIAAGVPVLTAEEYAAREAACRACINPRDGLPTWEESAYFGLGKCRACGCSRLKRWMRTERCRLGRWPELP